ncbi:hypothetical protein AMR42_01580 [Limnothrix sp. PR1529]|nr:hypothetical protein BCR12_00455 [Limnothrix sp. P13C2]PIB15227.1 hypothetical protein AMR42_01580 [Limnothrix sp. PR1529]
MERVNQQNNLQSCFNSRNHIMATSWRHYGDLVATWGACGDDPIAANCGKAIVNRPLAVR